ncbi:beta galactosidase jelly roll domain-containing protein, partial [Amycolatopsis mediterranei]
LQGGSADPVRGPLNNGGLAGERAGWHLPGFPDRAWAPAAVPAATADPGTTWYRTTFSLRIPRDQDTSVGLTIGDPAKPRSGGRYRVLVFLNGWNVGQYIGDVGPQHTFVLPAGILDPHGRNTLALAVTSDGGPGNGLEKVALTDLGTARGGVPVRPVFSPGWRR